MRGEALGSDYAEAKRRCDDLLNPQFDAWRTRDTVPEESARAQTGTFDWMASVYRGSPKFTELPLKTQQNYDRHMRLVADFVMKDGRRVGALDLRSIKPGIADQLYAKIKLKADGTERVRSAILAMAVCKRAWNIAGRSHREHVPAENPFVKMGLTYKPVTTRPVTYPEMMRLVAAADASGEPSIGTACMIAFFWLQRQQDIIARLSWTHYRPSDAPGIARIFHFKTGELVEVPLYDDDGTALWPDIMNRLDAAPRHGTLIVTRSNPDHRRKVHLPWQIDTFRHRVAELRTAAGVSAEAKFMGLRHGGNVEGAEADLTDAQLRALSGHRTTAALLRYAQATTKQRVEGARKRLAVRTKRGNLSE